jgi:hypothetical protein
MTISNKSFLSCSRSSLSEAVLVNELSKPSTREEEGNAVGTTGKAPESPKVVKHSMYTNVQ